MSTEDKISSEDLREQLAAIEHERWAHWQRYVHGLCVPVGGGLTIPASLVERWERQIVTPYADLTEDEKDSDRHQVDRYWHLLAARLVEVEAERDAAVARADRDHIELRDKRTDLLIIRGILSPNGGERVVPEHVPMVPAAAPAVEWIVAELEAARREHDDALAGVEEWRRTSDIHLAAMEAARPVVEAAVAWREQLGGSREVMVFGHLVGAQSEAMIAAVDLYRSATSDHPSTTEEKP